MKDKRRIIVFAILLTGLSVLTISCKKDVKIPELFTTELSAITQTTAMCGGYINSDDEKKAEITERGVCWSISPNPSISDQKTSDGTGSGSYTSIITGLTSATTYYLRAYATNSAGTAYGNTISFTTTEDLIDYDGNIYNTVRIGTQTWMAGNLQVTHFRDGSMIPYILDNTAWHNLTSEGYCNYNNDLTNSEVYGKLYNWYAVHDSRNLAPVGWHVASYAEWQLLFTYLGSGNIAGGKLKETGTAHWLTPNTGATNEYGFTALPGGGRNDSGSFILLGQTGYWWCTPQWYSNFSEYFNITYNLNSASGNIGELQWGCSVRCVKD